MTGEGHLADKEQKRNKTRFAGVNVIRLSKCSRESVEEQVRTALKQNLNIQNKNEKSKTQEARDPAGSRLQRSEGV
jgi:hypothetical protein